MMPLSDEDGVVAVRAARTAIDAEVAGRAVDLSFPRTFSERYGVFVTISLYPSGDLRGCIGYPEPVYPLEEALIGAAISACHDPRFPPLTPDEAKGCTVEVTVLTPPSELDFTDAEDLVSKIELGIDGIILQARGRRSLFLPQVAPEQGWDTVQTLDALAGKAGLRPKAWTEDGVRIWTFQGEIFSEAAPYGKVIRS